MKRAESPCPDLLIYREPCYGSWIISVPFYFGILGVVLYNSRRILDAVSNFSIPDAHPLLFLLGLLFVVAFLIKIIKGILAPFDWFSRRGCKVDRRMGTVTADWGLFVLPMVRRTVRLEEFDTLRIHGWQWTRNGMISRTEYYLDLCNGKDDSVRLGRADDKDVILEMADDIAEFANLSLLDATYESPHWRRFADARFTKTWAEVMCSYQDHELTV